MMNIAADPKVGSRNMQLLSNGLVSVHGTASKSLVVTARSLQPPKWARRELGVAAY